MILTPEERIRRNVEDGAWSRLTVDQVFRRGLEADPDGIVFRDAGAPAVPADPLALSFREAHRRIDGIAAFLAGIGLKPDTVIGVHLPPSADAAVVILAALRAGLVVCPLPLHWSRGEMGAAVAAAGIRAVVTASSVEDEPSGERVRDLAAETFAIRFVFAVGAGVPDGLIDLATVVAELDQFGPPPPVARRGEPADHVALVSLARDADDRVVVVPFSHNHLIAMALAHVLEGRIDQPEVVLSTMHPASLAGFAGGLVTALLSGGQVTFHHPTRFAALAEAVESVSASRLVLPATFGPEAATRLAPDIALSLVATGLDPVRDGAALDEARRAVDLVTLDGLALLPTARRAGARASLPSGPVRLPRGAETGPVLFEARLKPRLAADRRPASVPTELVLSGALVADAPWPEPASGGSGAGLAIAADGSLRTGILAEVAADGDGIVLRGLPGEHVTVAGRPVSLARIDALLRRHPAVADAAVFAVETPHVGARLGAAVVPRPGEAIRLDDLAAFLDAEGGGPLDFPTTLAVVAAIPRRADGSVERRAPFLDRVA